MGEIQLEWKDHDKALSTKLWEFFKEEYLVDFNVTCHGQQMKVHKFILALLFPMLKESFRSSGTFSFERELATDGRSEESSVIPETHCLNLDNIADHSEDMDYLLQFAYTGKTTVPKEHADCLMHIADSMEIKSLKDSLGQWHVNSKLADETEQNDVTILTRLRQRPELKMLDGSVEMDSSDDHFDFQSELDEESKPDYIQSFSICSSTKNRVPKKHRSDDGCSKEPSVKSIRTENTTETLKKQKETDSKGEEVNGEVRADGQKAKPTNDAVKGKKTLKCPQCNYVAMYPNRLRRHLGSHARKQAKGSGRFPCKVCKKRFQTRRLLETHCNLDCRTEPPVLIEQSLDLVSSDNDDDDDDNDLDFQCIVDEESSVDSIECSVNNGKRNSRSSEKISTKQERILRKQQSKDVNSKEMKPQDSTESEEKLKKTNTAENSKVRAQQVKGKKNLKCPQCEYIATFPNRLKRHLRTHDKTNPRIPREYICRICETTFEKQSLYDAHRESNCGTIPQICKYCGHKSRRKLILLHHIMAKHQVDADGNPLEKNIKCPDCDFICYAKHQLQYHARAKHQRRNRFKCKECNYAAPYIGELQRHERVKHRHVRDYMCDECGVRYKSRGLLNRHVLVRHKGVKPFKCNICNAEYSSRLSYKVHMQRHEGKVEYKFVCHICGHNLRRKFELKRHMQNKHGIEMEEQLATTDDLDLRQMENAGKPTYI